MKLTTTLHNIKQAGPCKGGINRFLAAHPNLGEHEEISLLDILNNGHNTTTDVIWALRATVQDSRAVSVEFTRRCADRAATCAVYAADAAANAANAAYAAYAADQAVYAAYAADQAAHDACAAHATCAVYAAVAAAYAAYATDQAAADADAAEREHQKQDLINLLTKGCGGEV